jgi:ABC-type glycerol-3-phosphate transport system substrate-binding protein
LLSELSELDLEFAESGKSFDNILGAYTDDKSTYALPARFTFPSLFAKAATANEVNSFAGLVAAAQNKVATEPNEAVFSSPSVDSSLFAASYPELFGSDKKLNQVALKEFLEQLKTLTEVIKTGALVETLDSSGTSNNQVGGASSSVNAAALQHNPNLLGLGSIFSPLDFGSLELARAASGADLTFLPLSFAGKRSFEPNTVLGVNSKSPNTQAAKDFIRFMLSEQSQQADQEAGLPVNIASFKKALEQSKAMNSVVVDEQGKEQNYAGRLFVDPSIDDYVDLLKTLDTPVANELVIKDIIFTQAGSYIDGKTSLDDAVKSIAQKLDLYLAE